MTFPVRHGVRERFKYPLKTVSDTVRAYAWYREVRRQCLVRQRAAEPPRTRHLALLAWLFPPIISGGTYRSAALARYAGGAGWKVSVMGGPAPELPTKAGLHMLSYLPDSVRVARVKPPSLIPSQRAFPRVDGGFLNALATVSQAHEIFDEHPPAAVLASGPPFHNFVAAWHVARSYKSRLILEYRDEWTECPFDFVKLGNVDRKWEIRCLNAADAVIFPTQSLLEVHIKAFPFLARQKCVVIENGWEPDDIEAMPARGSQAGVNGNAIVVSFVGNLGSHTLPGEFLNTVSAMLEQAPDIADRLKLRFVGEKSPSALEQIKAFRRGGVIDTVDQVSKPEALAFMSQATALLIINHPDLHRALPGKLFDYIASGTPILVYGEGGEISRLVQSLDVGLVVAGGDARALEQAIRGLGGRERKGIDGVARDWLRQHTREKQALKVVDVIDRTCFGRAE